jgi:thiamine biosynthesis lipoprotein
MQRMALAGIWLFILTTGAASDAEPEANKREEQYYSETEARDRVFGAGLTWYDSVLVVDAPMATRLLDETGLKETDTLVRLSYTVGASGELAGLYRVASEMGKFRPFDFVVALDPNLKVKDIVVMNYRESRGGEVRRERFLRQYRGKSTASPVRLNRDVLGISGATLSAWAVNRGVKKTLWWADQTWNRGGDSR